MKKLILLALIIVGCGGTPGRVELPENYREQLHAVTGHDPEQCTDLRSAEATITITDTGFNPACTIVAAAQDVSIVNEQAIDDTWIVADPPSEAEIPRHSRGVFEVAAGHMIVVTGIGERVGNGVWTCYGRESRHECELVVVP